MAIGEYDKRLVILTKEYGKITVFAKGARKQHSALLACTQPFVFAQFTLYKGKTAYQLISVQQVTYFDVLRKDLEAVVYASYFCEVASYFTRENLEATEVLKLLYQSLRILEKNTIEKELVRYIYDLKITAYNGEAPQVFHCINCKKQDMTAVYFFHAGSGGILCKDCAKQKPNAIPIEQATVYTMQYILSAKIEKLYTFVVSQKVLLQLQCCMKQYESIYWEKQFQSLQLLPVIAKGEKIEK